MCCTLCTCAFGLQMAEMAGSMSQLTKTTLKSVNKLDPTKKKKARYYGFGSFY